MLTRRELLTRATGLAGAAALARPIAELLARGPQPKTPIAFNVPAGACDCHTHIFGDGKQFPFAPTRPYSPDTASLDDLRALHRALHIERVVIAQPTVYGEDHSLTMDAIKQLGPRARGIAEINEHTSDAEIDRLHRGGFRGTVIHGLNKLPAIAERLKNHPGWSIEFFMRLTEIDRLRDQILASPVPITFTLFGGAQAALGLQQQGFETLLGLLRSGKIYVQLSAPYRTSKLAPDYPDIAPIAKALIAANPDRILWGSDWPHAATVTGRPITELTPLEDIDDGLSLTLLNTWVSGPDQLKRILVDNPARLYGF